MHGRNPTTPSSPQRPIPSLALAAVAAVACLAAQWNVDGNRRIDFRIYYRSIESMTGGGLYDYGELATNFLYPPPAALLLRPITLLGESAASHLWLIASIAMALAGFHTALQSRPTTGRVPAAVTPLVAAACLWSAPVLLSFRLGQINPVIGALLCLDVYLMSRGRRGAGVATGIAAAIKLTPLLAIVLMFAGGRRAEARRAGATFAVTSALTALVLPGETTRFWSDVVFDASGVGGVGSSLNASILSLTGLVTDDHLVQRGLWIALAATLGLLTLRRSRKLWSSDALGAMTVAMCLSYAVSPLTWIHHQWFLGIAAVLWFDRARRPVELLVAGLGLVAALDPLGLGEESMLRTVVMVSFVVATVLRLPAPTDSPTAAVLPQDVASTPENRGAHV